MPLPQPRPFPQSREFEKGKRTNENKQRGKGVSKPEPTENLLPSRYTRCYGQDAPNHCNLFYTLYSKHTTIYFFIEALVR